MYGGYGNDIYGGYSGSSSGTSNTDTTYPEATYTPMYGPNGKVYSGECNPKCNGCLGPSSFECVLCVANSHIDDYGQCVCDLGFIGDNCGMMDPNYSVHCSPLCNTRCFGPTVYDCFDCIPTAYKNAQGACVCLTGWRGDDCSI